jgi:ubiquinone/menaquinone biosynthesis C-methylase UbiE
MAEPMDYATYFRELADYYNNSRIPSDVMTGVTKLREESNRTDSWVRECVQGIHHSMTGKRVMEVTCGAGRWTQFIAEVAEEVLGPAS